MARLISFARAVLVFVITLVVASTAVLYVAQDSLIFPSPKFAVTGYEDQNFTPVNIPTPDGEVLFGLHHPAENGEATILVFHGNADAAVFQKDKSAPLVEDGFGVLLVEYRGYPGSTGLPSEAGLFVDGKAAYDFIIQQKDQPIGLYAHSLGTGVAVKLATERDVFALVLESPFDSLTSVAQTRFPWVPVSLLLKHKFPSDEMITRVRAPILIMHGDKDRVVPIAHGRRLHEKAPEGTAFRVLKNAGHNNLARFQSSRAASGFFKDKLN